MLIMLCLLPLIVLTFLSVILGNELLSIGISHEVYGLIENNTIANLLDIDLTSSSKFNISAVDGAIAIIIVFATISIIMGVRILGLGLSETSIRMMTIGLGYTGIWLVLTLLANPLLLQIELFGSLIYIALTIGYVIGVVQKLSEG